MNLKPYLISLIFIFSHTLKAQIIVFNEGTLANFKKIIELPDGSVIAGIDANYYGESYSNFTLLKFDSTGKLMEDFTISSLKATDFMSLSNQKITFSKGINIFVGENGSGKSQILKLLYAVIDANNFIAKEQEEAVKILKYMNSLENTSPQEITDDSFNDLKEKKETQFTFEEKGIYIIVLGKLEVRRIMEILYDKEKIDEEYLDRSSGYFNLAVLQVEKNENGIRYVEESISCSPFLFHISKCRAWG